jgi:plasmid stability protein
MMSLPNVRGRVAGQGLDPVDVAPDPIGLRTTSVSDVRIATCSIAARPGAGKRKGGPLATLTIRNVDGALEERLRVRAAQHGRSIQDEARLILMTALGRQIAIFMSASTRASPHLAGPILICRHASRPASRRRSAQIRRHRRNDKNLFRGMNFFIRTGAGAA